MNNLARLTKAARQIHQLLYHCFHSDFHRKILLLLVALHGPILLLSNLHVPSGRSNINIFRELSIEVDKRSGSFCRKCSLTMESVCCRFISLCKLCVSKFQSDMEPVVLPAAKIEFVFLVSSFSGSVHTKIVISKS